MTPTSAPSHIANGDGAQQGHAWGDARGSSRTRERSHREAHVCELFDEPVHDPGLVLLAGRLHALEKCEQGRVHELCVPSRNGGCLQFAGVLQSRDRFVLTLTVLNSARPLPVARG